MICDVQHCDRERPHNHRLCVRCDTRLPAFLRVAITAAREERRGDDWRAACEAASRYLNLQPRDAEPQFVPAPPSAPPAPARPRVSPELSYALSSRLLGETD